MPTKEQIMTLLAQRGSLRLAEIRSYFGLRGAWLAPLTQVMSTLVAYREVYQDSFGAYLLEFHGL
jgi:hypothetical protein